jgi:uncharacterized protein YjcR
VEREELRTLWLSGMHLNDLAIHFGVARSTVTAARRKFGIEDRQNKYGREDVDPTPDELEQRKKEIRERHFAAMRQSG